MDSKNLNIKEIEIIFENCESIIIPFECFKKFDYVTNETQMLALSCLIEDNGNLKYSGILMDSEITPLNRLVEYEDIACVKIFFCNDTSRLYYVIWNDGVLDNNKDQCSRLLSHKEVSIEIKQYIETF